MDKRFKLWILLSLGLFLLNGLIMSKFFPPKPAPVAKKPAAEAKVDPKKNDAKVAPAEPAKPQAGVDEPVADKPAEAEVAAAPDKPAEPADEKPAPQKWITLGSADPTSPYRMLVTLNNAGAAVERIELNNSRYLNIDEFNGYLGHLDLTDAEGGGARVWTVGPGTPAQLAGMKVDDTIVSLAGSPVNTAKAVAEKLLTTKPSTSIPVEVLRDGKKQTLTVALRRQPLSVVRPEFDTYPIEVIKPVKHDPLSMLLTLQSFDDQSIQAPKEGGVGTELGKLDLWNSTWEIVDANDNSATFRKRLPDYGLEITKSYKLAKSKTPDSLDDPAYHLEFELSIRNVGEKAHTVAYQLDGPTGLPNEGRWYATKVSRNWSGGLRDVVVRFTGGKPTEAGCSTIADGTATGWTDSPLNYIAVDAQYFSGALIPRKERADDVWFSDVRPIRVGELPKEAADHKLTDVSFRLTSRPESIQPNGEPLTHKFTFFAGPKRPRVLEQYTAVPLVPETPVTLDDLVYYGWFGWVAKPMLALLHAFYSVVHNYGIAIIMLTVVVRGAMFPISRKQAQSAAKMQELQPKIKEIAEKHKSNPQDRQKAQMELFRKHNYNPLAGCLPMFIQLPIFIGLYRSLVVDVELRQAPLISQTVRWCSNLAAPDMLMDWTRWMPEFVSKGHGFFGLGPYLNVLPLITIVLFLWQQKMFMPPPTDEQTAMQQKMMKYMMVFMGFMFFKVASGLCLYFIASSLWGITERKMLPKTTPPGTTIAPVAKTMATNVSTNGSGGKGKKRQKN